MSAMEERTEFINEWCNGVERSCKEERGDRSETWCFTAPVAFLSGAAYQA